MLKIIEIIALLIAAICALYMSYSWRENLMVVIACRVVAGMTALSAFINLCRLDSFKEMMNDLRMFFEQRPYWIAFGVGVVLIFALVSLLYYLKHKEQFAELKRQKEAWKK